jgi:hypothetical protein
MKKIMNNISSKIIPTDYEDCIASRSIISYSSNHFKHDNIVSFNPQNINEVDIKLKLGILF